MNSFIGKYTSRLDEKGRLVFPAPLKGVMAPGGDMRFVVKKDIFRKCLEMLTYEEWTAQTEAMKARLDFLNPKHVSFWSYYTSGNFVVEPDSRLGRISIPRELLDYIGATKEVVFSGGVFKIEIWAREEFEKSRISHEEFIAIAESLSQSRQAE